MILFLSKGVPYNENCDTSFKVWSNGTITQLTSIQKIIWNFLYGKVRSYDDLIRYVYYLFREKKNIISKQELNQTLCQLKSLDLICYEENDDFIKGEYLILTKNKINILLDNSDFNEFEQKLYQFIKKYVNISLADFIIDLNEQEYNKLTNGFDDEYLSYAFNSRYRKTTIETIKSFMTKGIIYID